MEIFLHEVSGDEPLTVKEAVDALRLDYFEENEIKSLITAAREAAEDYTRQNFVQKKFYYVFEERINEFYLQRQGVTKINSVKATKNDGNIFDVTDCYKLVPTIGKIIKVHDFDYANLVIALTFDLTFDITQPVQEKVKQAMIWHIVNSYHHTQPSEWFVSFKDLLRDIRITTV